jgi:hypothetical protein
MKIRTILSVLGNLGAFLLAVLAIQMAGTCTVAGIDGILRPDWEGDVTMGKALLLFSGMVTVVIAIALVAGMRAMNREHQRLMKERPSEPAMLGREESA